MDKCAAIIIALIFLMLSVGCNANAGCNSIGIETCSHVRQVYEIEDLVGLGLDIENGNVSIFTWDRNEVKFEMKKIINGNADRDTLQSMLDNFKVTVDQGENIVALNCRYKGKSVYYSKIDLVVYVPRRIDLITCSIESGNIKLVDDIKCSFRVLAGKAFVDINNFEGKIDIIIDEGGLAISNGTIYGDSSVLVKKGNINIKAGLDENGYFSFETLYGNIDLKLPEDIKTGFTSSAIISTNEFKGSSYPSRVKVSSKIGRVTITKLNSQGKPAGLP